MIYRPVQITRQHLHLLKTNRRMPQLHQAILHNILSRRPIPCYPRRINAQRRIKVVIQLLPCPFLLAVQSCQKLLFIHIVQIIACNRYAKLSKIFLQNHIFRPVPVNFPAPRLHIPNFSLLLRPIKTTLKTKNDENNRNGKKMLQHSSPAQTMTTTTVETTKEKQPLLSPTSSKPTRPCLTWQT